MSPGGTEYRVVYSEAIRAALRDAVEVLLKAGWEKRAVADLVQSMDDRLRHGPNDFGEPLYRLRATKIIVSVGFARPLTFQFAVHEESRSVFVRKLVLMTTDRPE